MSRPKFKHKPTERQLEIWHFMVAYNAEHGTAPTLREIADHLQISSTNGVSDHLKAMQTKGMVLAAEGRARSWRPVT